MNDLILGLIIFILTYVLMIAIPNYRAHVAVTSAALFVILGLLPISEILPAIDFNVLMMIAGTMGIVSLFIESKMPSLLADYIIDKMPNVKWVVISLSVFAGIISAFVDNVATVLMVAPVAITVADKLNIKPVKMVIAIAIASNLQGAATLVGDTTSILLGGYANMNFMDFIIYDGKPGMFFVVQLAMIAATAVLYFVFKEYNQEVHLEHFTEVEDYFPTFLLVGTILSLIIASFIPNTPDLINGYICMAYLILGIIVQSKKTSFTHAISLVKADMDFFTLFLLAGLFVVIGGISYVGVIDEIANIFVKFGSDNIFVLYTIIVFASVILSAFIDNIPYVATMLPVVTGIAIHLGVDPTLLYFGLLSGATLGGNLTPIGASANITAIGILKKNGHEVPSSTFMKISIPYTLAAVFTGYVLIWFLFG
ncbi:MAG: SLC13 family permease [Erysipelotrichaceae bacterium]|jgi:Na+/H+ antiporter NhaD/arsenite permease-like protein|nr:SLC13 family permease [Bacillota bacterium]NLP22545.1 TRAP transporter large permease subunit [Erysipelotrichaceae bacterium]